MYMNILFFTITLSNLLLLAWSSNCVCTTVSCPMVGTNNLVMGGGYAKIAYEYELHRDYPVVISASGTITPDSLDKGTDTTSCTQKYARQMDDDGIEDCDAGHILANRLGGYGNQPINIFPQDLTVNRGAYAQYESNIYHCMLDGAKVGNIEWQFLYTNSTRTKPHTVIYSVSFDGGSCKSLTSTFTNGL